MYEYTYLYKIKNNTLNIIYIQKLFYTKLHTIHITVINNNNIMRKNIS